VEKEPNAHRLALLRRPTRRGLPAFVSLPPADPNLVVRRDEFAK
jgi:hypothetical protein